MSSLISPFGTDSTDMFGRTEITPQNVKRTRFGLKMPVVRQEEPKTPIIQSPTPQNSQPNSLNSSPLVKYRYTVPETYTIPRIKLDSTINEISDMVKNNSPSLEIVKMQLDLNDHEKLPALRRDIQELENRLSNIKNIEIQSYIRPHKTNIKRMEDDADQMLTNFDKINSPMRDNLTRLNTQSQHLLDEFNAFQTFVRTSFNQLDASRKANSNNLSNSITKILKLDQNFDPIAKNVGDRNADFSRAKVQSTNALNDLQSLTNYSTTSISAQLSKSLQEESDAKNAAAEKLRTNIKNLNDITVEIAAKLKSSIDAIPKIFSKDMENLSNQIQASINDVNSELDENNRFMNLQIDDTFDVTSSTFNDISKEIVETVTKIKKNQEDSTKVLAETIDNENKETTQNYQNIKQNMIELRFKTETKIKTNQQILENWSNDTMQKSNSILQENVDFIEEGISKLHENFPALEKISNHIADIEKAVQQANKYAMDKILTINSEYENLLADYSNMNEVYMKTINDFYDRVNKMSVHAKIEDAVYRKDVFDYVTKYETYIDSVFHCYESQLAVLTSGADEILEGVNLNFKLNDNFVGIEKPIPIFEGHSRIIHIKPVEEENQIQENENINEEQNVVINEVEKDATQQEEVIEETNNENKNDENDLTTKEEKCEEDVKEKSVQSKISDEYYSDYYYSDNDENIASESTEVGSEQIEIG